MAWIYLTIAGLLEIGWAIGLKYTDGFSKPLPTIATVTAMVVSMVLLSYSLKTIPVGTGYAVWTGIGAVGTAVCGIILFDEPRDVVRILCIGLIVAGILGLKFASPAS
ncbi:quaternary ammonium compound efflux SMR transporter SugE [Neorhodopirellula lusitana]|uniref:quaternary ammonium compound efflux SMR transporter SugE n=1 Tax=Neorhodopirellula lusitana TaxID=445327 RepID=UPI00384F31A3